MTNIIKKVNLLFRSCNLKCPMCSMNAQKTEGHLLRDYDNASTREMVLDDYKSFFKQFVGEKITVSIAGGEPFLYKDLFELVCFLKVECGFGVGIGTNGTLITDEIFEKFISIPDISMTFSVDGTKEIHDSIRGEGAYEKVIAAIKRFTEKKKQGLWNGRIYGASVLQTSSYKTMPELAQILLDDIGVDSMVVSALIYNNQNILNLHNKWVEKNQLGDIFKIKNIKGGSDEFLTQPLECWQDMYNVIDLLRDKYKRLKIEPNFKNFNDLHKYYCSNDKLSDYYADRCSPAQNNITLLSNGDIIFFPGCFELNLGNVTKDSIESIWESDLYSTLRTILEKKSSPVCSHCCANRKAKFK